MYQTYINRYNRLICPRDTFMNVHIKYVLRTQI